MREIQPTASLLEKARAISPKKTAAAPSQSGA